MKKKIQALMLERQHLRKPVEEKAYETLFRLMSPVQNSYWSCPGVPPCLPERAAFDDEEYCFRLREEHTIIKGRFQGGNIAYIYADELPVFGAVYRKEGELSETEGLILELLNREGPMTIHVLKEFTGLLTREITASLKKLQEKFLVFEDQSDSEWDRAFYPFESEFGKVGDSYLQKKEAVEELLLRFAYLHVYITVDMARSFYKFPAKVLKEAFQSMVEKERLIPWEGGFLRPEDKRKLENMGEPDEDRSVFLLNRNDFLVKSHETELKKRYVFQGEEILGYFLCGGEFSGVLLGKFRNGPFELHDVRVDDTEKETEVWKGRLLEAVRHVYDPEKSPLPCFQGVSCAEEKE